MRKSVLAVMAAGSIFALTAAGAAGLGTVSSDNVNLKTSGTTSTITTNSCTDAYSVNYGYDAATGETVTKAGLTNAAETAGANCVSVPYSVDITANSVHYTVSGTTDTNGDAALADLNAAIAYGEVISNVKVTIGPKA